MHTVMLRLAVKVALKSGHFVARGARYTLERKKRLKGAAAASVSRSCQQTD